MFLVSSLTFFSGSQELDSMSTNFPNHHVFIVVDGCNVEGGVGVYVNRLHKELLENGISSSIISKMSDISSKIIKETLIDKPVVFHVNGLWSLLGHRIIRLAVAEKVPIVISTHGMLDPWALRQKFLKKKLAWYLYQRRDMLRASVVHTTSLVESQNVRDSSLNTEIFMVPNGVDLPPLYKKMKGQFKVVLFLSRIHPGKGLEDLIEAWSLINTNGWRLLIAGDGRHKYKEIIKRKIVNLNLETEISMLGHVSGKDKELLYQKSDLFILPSYSENFGLAIAEAMSYGLPVITTKLTPWKVIEERNCGWWVDTGVESLSDALVTCFRLTRDELSVKGKNGRKVISNNFVWSKVILELNKMYSKVGLDHTN